MPTWPDEYFAEDTRKSISKHLSGYTQQDIESPSQILSIEASLSSNGVSGIRDTSCHVDVCHDHNQDVLLDIKFAGVQTERFSEEPELSLRHYIVPSHTQWVRHELYREGGDGDSGLT